MQRVADSFGVEGPGMVTDRIVLKGLQERAEASAHSITRTRATRMASLVEQHGLTLAKQKFYVWDAGHQAAVARYEAAQTTSQAMRDFTQRNQMQGIEFVDPQSAARSDACLDGINMGEQPIGTIEQAVGDFPQHLHCPHSLMYQYTAPDDPSALWFG
jgi:hypothetical protein